MEKNYLLEVVCFTAESAIAAQEGGADRVELCENFTEGGNTPGFGTIKLTREKLHIALNVMIRPRGGDFLYSDLEFEIMKADILQCRVLGINGVVFGILNADGSVDRLRCKQLTELASPMSTTFHRAFDMTANPVQSLEDLIDCGFTRVLTSGQKMSAMEGKDLLQKLVQQAGKRIIIMPGGGVRSHNIEALVTQTGASEYHTSAHLLCPSPMVYRNPSISMGSSVSSDEYQIRTVHAAQVREVKQVLTSLHAPG